MKNNFFRNLQLIIVILFFLSCNSNQGNIKTETSSKEEINTSICPIHNENCEKLANDMKMNIEDYHTWKDKVQQEVENEDAAIESVEGNSSNNSSNSELNNSSNSNRECHHCRPSDPKGWRISDYNDFTKTYSNERWILRPGYKPCLECAGTGNCKSQGNCSSSQEREGNFICQFCHGDRFKVCEYCKGSGIERS